MLEITTNGTRDVCSVAFHLLFIGERVAMRGHPRGLIKVVKGRRDP